jgi:hypothetical protein
VIANWESFKYNRKPMKYLHAIGLLHAFYRTANSGEIILGFDDVVLQPLVLRFIPVVGDDWR